ncbi:hypothetical protein MAR_023434 [Mya arenaria]|uniref:Uncharacterized protein n=1 Tax=Mya arenaria TaxID=6604 RepID=A0ABY7DMY4_MYAAR|nr:hypothetical protein MAR_023434 [Mya arenaria]
MIACCGTDRCQIRRLCYTHRHCHPNSSPLKCPSQPRPDPKCGKWMLPTKENTVVGTRQIEEGISEFLLADGNIVTVAAVLLLPCFPYFKEVKQQQTADGRERI